MKSYKLIHEAFKKREQSTREWYKTSHFPKSEETANSILYRDAVVDASTLAYMAFCLDIPNGKIVDILDQYSKEQPKKAAEVEILKKLIAPTEIDKSEIEFLERFRKLDDSKRELVLRTIEGFGG